MIVRITRHPLTDEQTIALRAEGVLPADYADRAAIARDYVEVPDGTEDCDAIAQAREGTALKLDGGERIEFHRVHGPQHTELLCE